MLIALLTDFGTEDAYVGVMKGVILTFAPSARLVDITHAIQPQNVRQAAFTLLNTYTYFPPETIFLVVVDPGVGSERRAIAVRAGQYTFVAPDNGVLSYALAALGEHDAVSLDNPVYQLKNVSTSFHGRDIFAPAAAHLAAGVPLKQFGAPITDLVQLPRPALKVTSKTITGEVLHIDHYGNIVTSIGHLSWTAADQLTLRASFAEDRAETTFNTTQAKVRLGVNQITHVYRSYSDVARGQLLLMVGSSGYLEIATNHDNAAAQLGVSLGDSVFLDIG